MKPALPTTRRPIELQTVIKCSRAGWLGLLPGVGLCTIVVGASAAPLSGEVCFSLLTVMGTCGAFTALLLSHRIVVSAVEITIHQGFSKTSVPLASIERFHLRFIRPEHYMLEIDDSALPSSPLSFDLFAYSPAAIISLVRNVKRVAPQIEMKGDARNAFQGYLT